ncbi:MAG: macro domain-containing protein [Candidatus Accumulibacter sp.]|jgi:O-acetyl-ADP-ribose deacetylase (regulator of RNase III)|nr:macro domain-containing protein [Accumulibacter sp.]
MEPAPRNDVFACKEAEALVNAVNCVGIMGRGLAVKFKKAFPDNFKIYAEVCKKGEMRLGQVLVHDRHGNFDLFTAPENPRWIINFPTKMHWRSKSCIEYIETGLESLVEAIRSRGMRSVAVPALGCGLGGLDWRKVRPRIERAFDALPEVRVYLCEPGRDEPESTPGTMAPP